MEEEMKWEETWTVEKAEAKNNYWAKIAESWKGRNSIQYFLNDPRSPKEPMKPPCLSLSLRMQPNSILDQQTAPTADYTDTYNTVSNVTYIDRVEMVDRQIAADWK